jgi:dipeptidase
MDVSTENFYWTSALLGALADHSYNKSVQFIVRYQDAVLSRGRRLLKEYDEKMLESGDCSLAAEANEKLAAMAKEESEKALYRVLRAASETMKNGYNRADN